MAEPLTTCGVCDQTDDHPKHQIMVGFNNPTVDGFDGGMFHRDDLDRDGQIHYHFDCPTVWHLAVVNPPIHEDPGANAEKQRVAEVQQAIMAQAQSGVHGDELRQWIMNLAVRGGSGGIDQTMATAILAALSPNSGTKTIGTVTITGPIKMRLMTATGTDSSAGTELGTSGGYTAGGSSLTMGTAATGSITTTASVSWTSFPSATLTAMEQWDSSATPLRSFWGPWSSGSIVVASGNTFTVATGNLTDTLA